MRKVRFGIIGCGLMGREFASAVARWCHLLDMNVQPEIVGVSDVNPKAMEWFQTHWPAISRYEDYRELLSNKAIEAVYVAIPHHLHEQVYLGCIESGKHLMAEKPFGIDLSSAKRLVEAVKNNPQVLVRCSSEFPFYPGAQRIIHEIEAGNLGEIFEIRAGFHHSSDLDPHKPMNWKRNSVTCGEYGCMGDLGLHVLHIPLRLGFNPTNVRSILSNIVKRRPNNSGQLVECDTWDNATMLCTSEQGIPMTFETKRIAPGEMNTWFLKVYGSKKSMEFSTKYPKSLWILDFVPGKAQVWQEEDLGSQSAVPTITGGIFEFGFSDAILQMWASFLIELSGEVPKFPCATPHEALSSHELFTAALLSHSNQSVESVIYDPETVEEVDVIVAGHICVDLLPKFPHQVAIEPGKLIEVGEMNLSSGGAVANVGIALSKLGVKVNLVGNSGTEDFLSKELVKYLEANGKGLSRNLKTNRLGETSYSVILGHSQHDRTFFHFPGSNNDFQSSDVEDAQLRHCRILHFGYPPLMLKMMERNGAELVDLFKRANSYGVATSLDMSLPDESSSKSRVNWKQFLINVLPYVDFFMPSEDELAFMMSDLSLLPDRLAQECLDMGCGTVVIKQGTNGLYLKSGNIDRIQQIHNLRNAVEWVNKEISSPSFAVSAVGTTGSGDASIAGFLCGILHELSPDSCLELANAVAARSVMEADATSGIGTYADTKNWIETRPARRAIIETK